MMLSIVKWLLIVVVVLALALLVAGQAGLLGGTPPADLGVRDGRLKAPSGTANSVSSQAALWVGHPQSQAAQIAPLPLKGSPERTLATLQGLVRDTPGGAVVRAEGAYLYATFTTRWLKFTDDVEFWIDPAAQVVQVRSASRLGKKDLGANRARVENLRARLAALP